jgi:hypothetical protein
MLDAVAADSEYAVEAVRAKKRLRARELESLKDEDGLTLGYRDPGYSQAVRKTCQQRMVQLIPVRRGTLSVVLSLMWALWITLVVAHYWTHVPGDSEPKASAWLAAGIDTRWIAQLFHLRSSYSIAHWLTCQLWMLTAISAWMIFQLRRHKLDDYRARYRIWAVLACVALFSSFDASTSVLQLVGKTIDGWSKKEIGYGGWPLVLASFASIVGVLGIRLCGELKSAPMSVACWLIGLSAWATSALLGTNLIKTTWSPATIDMIVGSCWLGGVLAVFQASGIYLRQTYIQAQKRFLQRQGANLAPIQWKMPSLPKRRPRATDSDTTDNADIDSEAKRSKWRMPWPRRRELDPLDEEDVDSETSTASRSSRTASVPADARRDDSSNGKRTQDERESSKNPRKRLFGFIPNRYEQNEQLEGEPLRQDDGPVEDRGLTKAPGWFGIGGNRAAASAQQAVDRDLTDSPMAKSSSKDGNSKDSSRNTHAQPSSSATRAGDSTSPNQPSENKKDKKSFWPLRRSTTVSTLEGAEPATKTKRNWLPKLGRKKQNADEALNQADSRSSTTVKKSSAGASGSDDSSQSKTKKPWLSFGSKKTAVSNGENSTAKTGNTATPKPEKAAATKTAKRSFFGLFDGLKLNPPNDDKTVAKSATPVKPVPIQQGQSLPSTQPDADEDDGDENNSNRPMSKAERKKMRRMQQDDRRAA